MTQQQLRALAARIDNGASASASQGFDVFFVLCGQSNAEGASGTRDARYDTVHSNVFAWAPLFSK